MPSGIGWFFVWLALYIVVRRKLSGPIYTWLLSLRKKVVDRPN